LSFPRKRESSLPENLDARFHEHDIQKTHS
jgi:hypothetical protein